MSKVGRRSYALTHLILIYTLTASYIATKRKKKERILRGMKKISNFRSLFCECKSIGWIWQFTALYFLEIPLISSYVENHRILWAHQYQGQDKGKFNPTFVLGWDLLLPISCVNMRWKICVLHSAAGRRPQIFHLIFTLLMGSNKSQPSRFSRQLWKMLPDN